MRIVDLGSGAIFGAELRGGAAGARVLVLRCAGGRPPIVIERLRSAGWAVVEASGEERRALDDSGFYLPTMPPWALERMRRQDDEERPLIW